MIPLGDALQVGQGLGLVIGGFVGLMLYAPTTAQMAAKFGLWCAIGTFVGTVFGAVVWLAIQLNGGVG